MKSTGEMSCRLEGMTEKTTVGDLFYLSCEWNPNIYSLNSPVRMELSQKTSPYALVILKQDFFVGSKASFTVTGYQPGKYHTKIKWIGKNNQLESNPLSWQIHSVIAQNKQSPVNPYPPYGPWWDPLPMWYWPGVIGFVCAFLIIVFFKVRTALKRKKNIQKIKERLKNKSAFREFISRITLLTRLLNELEKEQFFKKLKKYFSLFLEDQFFIFAVNESPSSIVKQMKKYCPFVKPEQRESVFMFYKELQKSLAARETLNTQDLEQLIHLSREIVIQLYESQESQCS